MTTRPAETSPRIYAIVAGFTFLFYIAAGLTSMALGDQPQVIRVLTLLMNFSALVLGVTLYVITRAHGPALAMLALTCRVVEAVSGDAPIFFAAGSLLFCWLLLRGRMIPAALAWLGVVSSALLVVVLPLQEAGLLGGTMTWSASVTWLVWLPMLVFELVVSAWLIIKGVATPVAHNAALVSADYAA